MKWCASRNLCNSVRIGGISTNSVVFIKTLTTAIQWWNGIQLISHQGFVFASHQNCSTADVVAANYGVEEAEGGHHAQDHLKGLGNSDCCWLRWVLFNQNTYAQQKKG